jgi:hypothetical protein
MVKETNEPDVVNIDPPGDPYDVGCKRTCGDCMRRTPCCPTLIGAWLLECHHFCTEVDTKWQREKVVDPNPTTMICGNMEFFCHNIVFCGLVYLVLLLITLPFVLVSDIFWMLFLILWFIGLALTSCATYCCFCTTSML